MYKRQVLVVAGPLALAAASSGAIERTIGRDRAITEHVDHCLLYTSDAADERSSVDLGGRRIIKTKKNTNS